MLKRKYLIQLCSHGGAQLRLQTYVQNNTCRKRKQFWTSLPSIKWSVRNMLKETVYLQIPYLPKRKGSFKTVTYDMSNMFWPTWAIDLFAKNVAIMGPGYVARVPRNALSQMSNRLKMAKARFPVTHRIMGTPLTLFKMWEVCQFQGCKCTHTCQRPMMVEIFYVANLWGNLQIFTQRSKPFFRQI